jgi:hypothetical protein
MAYTKAELEGWVASQNPEDRKKVVNILKDEFGTDSLKMSDIVRLQPPDRVAKVLELQAKKGGKPSAAKPGATKAAPGAAAKPGVGKKAAVKQPDPEPDPEVEEEQTEEETVGGGGASLEDIQAAVAEALAPLSEALAAIQETLAETGAAAMRAEIMAKQAALAGGFSEEDLDALVAGE